MGPIIKNVNLRKNKNGSGAESERCSLNLPMAMVRRLGLTTDDPVVEIQLTENNEIKIKKL